MRPVYEAHKRFLQHLQHRHAGDRWVLKTPAHMAWLDTLLAVYPDACLIQCHRDPAKIIPSLANNLLQYRKLYSTLRPAGSYGMLELQADSLRKVDAHSRAAGVQRPLRRRALHATCRPTRWPSCAASTSTSACRCRPRARPRCARG